MNIVRAVLAAGLVVVLAACSSSTTRRAWQDTAFYPAGDMKYPNTNASARQTADFDDQLNAGGHVLIGTLQLNRKSAIPEGDARAVLAREAGKYGAQVFRISALNIDGRGETEVTTSRCENLYRDVYGKYQCMGVSHSLRGESEAIKITVAALYRLEPARAATERPWARLAGLIQAGDVARVRQALNDGANPNATAPGRDPLLRIALAGGNPELVRALMEAGADPAAKIYYGKDQRVFGTLLHTMVNKADAKVLEPMYTRANVNTLNSRGEIPLHAALESYGLTQFNDLEIVRMLLEKGADPNAPTSYGTKPLDIAKNKMKKDENLMKLLQAHGAIGR